jgi:ATP-dependent DNA ligase
MYPIVDLVPALEAIEAAPRGNARLDKIKELAHVPDLKRFLVDANDPFITFGVAKIPEQEQLVKSEAMAAPAAFADTLFGIAEQLKTRALSGNAARTSISGLLEFYSPLEAKWARRFLLKDLRLNIGGSEVQKVFGEDALFLFDVPLATDINKVKKWDSTVPWIVQPKLDGGRCVTFYDSEGNVELLSRTGQTWENFESIKTLMVAMGLAFKLRNYVVDGEVVSLDADGKINFQQIQKTMMRGDGVEVGNLQYVAFDGCTMDEWKNPKLTYGQRYAGLKNLLARNKCAKFRVIEALERQGGTVEDMKAAAKLLVAEGYEGGIIRRRDAVVENKRGKLLLKVKFFIDSEAEVIGVIEGEGRHVGSLGALKCRWASGVEFDMGSGLSDADRKDMWATSPVGNLVNFKYFEVTDEGKPRFPIYRSLRSRKDVGPA